MQYTKAGALTLFFFLRLIINLLVIGIFTYPMSYVFPGGRFQFNGQTFGSFLLSGAGGLTILATVVLYYRKFLVEYLTASRLKLQWPYWAVNVPVLGILAFPLVVLTESIDSTEEERTRLFYQQAYGNRRPFAIAAVMVVFSLIGMWVVGRIDYSGRIQWMYWFILMSFFIWYIASISGYYAVLSAGAIAALYFINLLMGKHHDHARFIYQPSRYDQTVALWYAAAFAVAQYAILLPVFHLQRIRTVQEAPADAYFIDEVGNPTDQLISE
jgi:hypothetical protein